LPPALSPEPALVVASVLGRDLEAASSAIQAFAQLFGRLAYTSEPISFGWTDHYRAELGERPVRRFVALRDPMDPSELPRLKRATTRMEVTLARPGKPREVNVDPGVVNAHQLVLASTKPRGHRIYLGQGIFADLMLLWEQDRFRALPWTYPDYADDGVRELFGRMRQLHLVTRRLRAEACSR
jgi:hypothetical protein